MTEFELKFEIPPAHLKNVAIAVLEGNAKRQRLQASYFDTPDGALAKRGIVLRLRKEGRRWVQTAKGSTTDVLERLEHNVTLGYQGAGHVPAVDVSLHAGTPIGKAIDKAIDKASGSKSSKKSPSLVLMYGTDIQRISRRVAQAGSVVEIALDQGRVFANGRSQSICELEIELKEGLPSDAVALAHQWCAAHGLWISTIAKSMKGQRLRDAMPFGAATPAVAAAYPRSAAADEMMTAVVVSCLRQILPNASELASGSNHPDHVHQLRVGIRRLRTALRELGGLTDAIDPAWEVALVQAFRALGAHRDHSHLALVLQPQLLAAGGPDIGFDDDNVKVPDSGDTVRSPDFQAALLGLLGFVYRDIVAAAGATVGLKKAVALRLEKLHKRALHAGKNFLALDEAGQHSVRKRMKRLRYLIEFAGPLFSAGHVRHMATALKPVQDALGHYNDELMALHALRVQAANDLNAWFGIGWLTARRQSNAKRCFRQIKAFAELEPFWRR